MIVGLGTDVVSLARLAASLERTPALRERIFTAVERDLPLESLAARFAAKEALVKALGAPPGLSWQEVEVPRGGAPAYVVHGALAALLAERGVTRTHLSLSHDGGVALACCILESCA